MGCISSKSPSADEAANKSGGKNAAGADGGANIQLDARLPFLAYREAFQLKNYWKSVRRRECASKDMFWKFLKGRPDVMQKYSALKNLSADDERVLENPEFESLAQSYLQIFDDVIGDIENSPGNVDASVRKLTEIGKIHKRVPGMNAAAFQGMEEPFMFMVQEVLQDRFNDKSEALFKKFFQFCLKYIVQGYEN